MKKVNDKGFTLVELLVTIAIMLTILGIAIVSYVNISSRKKTEAYESIKTQIEAAAEQYFQSNSYLLNELNSNGSTAIVSIGELVKADYLNKVTDPRDGTTLNECNYVEVSKNNNGYNYDFVDDIASGEECSNKIFTVVTEAGAPSAKIKFYNESWQEVAPASSGWFNSSVLGGENKPLLVGIEVDTKGNGTIDKVEVNNQVVSENNNVYSYKVQEDGIKNNVQIVVANKAGKTVTYRTSWKKDTTVPNGNTSIASTKSYNSNIVNLSITNFTDATSGIAKAVIPSSEIDANLFSNGSYTKKNYSLSSSLDGKSYSVLVKLYDKAGNERKLSTLNYLVYKECSVTSSKVSTGNWSKCSKACGGGTQSRTNVTMVVDNNTSKTCSSKNNIETQKCNVAACDTTPPNCPQIWVSYKGGGWQTLNTSRSWQNQNIKFKVRPTQDTAKWVWSTNNSAEEGKTISGNAERSDIVLSLEGSNRALYLTVYDAAGNKRNCNYTGFKIDKTTPNVDYHRNPVPKSCGGKSGINSGYKVSDSLSGLASVKDYFSLTTLSWSDGYAINRSITAGQKTFEKQNTTWSGAAGSCGGDYNKPVSGKEYYHYLKACDVAGNCTGVNKTQKTSKIGG